MDERGKRLKYIIEAAFYLNICKYKKIVNVTLNVPFYCGPT
jgi:hypothetical protein